MYYVYMIRCMDDSIYTGYTNNLEKRYREHERVVSILEQKV